MRQADGSGQQVPLDQAMEYVAELTMASTIDTGAMTVHTGTHLRLGRIHIVMSPIGDCLVLLAG